LDLRQEKVAFLEAFSKFHGGLSFAAYDEVLFGYSASMFIEIVANVLRQNGLKDVGLIHPTYDASFHILTRHDLKLHPISEADLDMSRNDMETLMQPLDAVMLTLPNNPTGWTPTSFVSIAEAAARTGTYLIIDACFRLYEGPGIDHYAVLRAAGTRAVMIEDTGKIFCIKDQKVGLMTASGPLAKSLRAVHHDFLLDVPLCSLVSMQRLLNCDGVVHAARLRDTAARNRAMAIQVLSKIGLEELGQDRSAVQLFRLPDSLIADDIRTNAVSAGVAVVAANGFYWTGECPGQLIRIALARTPYEFDRQLQKLSQVITRMLEAQPTTIPRQGGC